MPTYEYRCLTCSKITSEYRSVENRNISPICSCTGEMVKVISAPSMVMPDIKAYNLPGTKKWITSRGQHREHLIKHDLIEVGNEERPPSHD